MDRGNAAVGALFELDGDAFGEGLRIDRVIPPLDQELRALPQLARRFAGQQVFDDGATLWTRVSRLIPRSWSARVLAMTTWAPNEI